jgi:hypothetical protein
MGDPARPAAEPRQLGLEREGEVNAERGRMWRRAEAAEPLDTVVHLRGIAESRAHEAEQVETEMRVRTVVECNQGVRHITGRRTPETYAPFTAHPLAD